MEMQRSFGLGWGSRRRGRVLLHWLPKFPLAQTHTPHLPFPSLFILKQVINPGPPRRLGLGDSPGDGRAGGWGVAGGSPGRTRARPGIGCAASFLPVKDSLLPNLLIQQIDRVSLFYFTWISFFSFLRFVEFGVGFFFECGNGQEFFSPVVQATNISTFSV